MGFDEEWAQLRGEAATRLNQLTDPSGGGTGGIGTDSFGSDPKMTAAGNKIATDVTKQTKNASKHANEATDGAASAFADWDIAAGLKKVRKTWEDQSQTLLGRLTTEAGGLRTARTWQRSTDIGVRNDLVGRSKINGL